MLSDTHKTRRMTSALTFLERYHNEGEDFLKSIVTGDETWILHDTPETKQQSQQWMHTNSPNKPKKFKQTFSNRKVMATVFWDQKGPLLVEFMQPGTTINAAVYCQTLQHLRRAIQNITRVPEKPLDSIKRCYFICSIYPPGIHILFLTKSLV
uniref:Histone-lysine N-methyltransferase SETMAR n=1 Tax=Sipha flava TaxID=143950 RepID=A0A2S2QK27_9HEMI